MVPFHSCRVSLRFCDNDKSKRSVDDHQPFLGANTWNGLALPHQFFIWRACTTSSGTKDVLGSGVASLLGLETPKEMGLSGVGSRGAARLQSHGLDDIKPIRHGGFRSV
jgi:hypothetical protein